MPSDGILESLYKMRMGEQDDPEIEQQEDQSPKSSGQKLSNREGARRVLSMGRAGTVHKRRLL